MVEGNTLGFLMTGASIVPLGLPMRMLARATSPPPPYTSCISRRRALAIVISTFSVVVSPAPSVFSAEKGEEDKAENRGDDKPSRRRQTTTDAQTMDELLDKYRQKSPEEIEAEGKKKKEKKGFGPKRGY